LLTAEVANHEHVTGGSFFPPVQDNNPTSHLEDKVKLRGGGGLLGKTLGLVSKHRLFLVDYLKVIYANL